MSQYEIADAGNNSGSIESLSEYLESEPHAKCKYWKQEIRAALKESEDWHKEAEACVRRYLDEREANYESEKRFNIYTSNVQIMQSALYNSIPKVEVSRVFKDSNDDVARVAANILQRTLQQDLDSPRTDFEPAMRDGIEDRLCPGLGAAWLRLETSTQTINVEQQINEYQEVTAEAYTYEKVIDQQVRTEHVHYKDFLYSPCRTWEERRWVGRRVKMTRDKLTERFGEEIGKHVPLAASRRSPTRSDDDTIAPRAPVFMEADIYEIWDRESRTTYWICLGCDYLLDEKGDPLGLTDFDPCPKPIIATTTTSRFIPRPDFILWQDQYNSLDLVNTRIDLLVSACKVVGVYDQSSEGVQRMLTTDENQLIPVDNWSMFAEKGGIKGVIDWLPIDMVATVLERLRQNREDLKQQVYELTGIADIIRGASKASETLGAQELKAQFASVRIQSLQRSVLDFGTEILRIKGEITARHFTAEMLAKKGSVQYLDPADLPFVPQAIQLLKDPGAFQWRISIQPDSLAQTDYAKEKAERIEFMTAISTYMEKAIMAVQGMPQLLPLTVSLLKFGIAGFRVGKEVEGAVDNALKSIEQQAQQPPKPEPNPEMEKVKAEVEGIKAKTQAEVQGKQQKNQADMQIQRQKVMMAGQTNKMKLQQQREKMVLDRQNNVMKQRMQQEQQLAKIMGAGPQNPAINPQRRVPPQ